MYPQHSLFSIYLHTTPKLVFPALQSPRNSRAIRSGICPTFPLDHFNECNFPGSLSSPHTPSKCLVRNSATCLTEGCHHPKGRPSKISELILTLSLSLPLPITAFSPNHFTFQIYWKPILLSPSGLSKPYPKLWSTVIVYYSNGSLVSFCLVSLKPLLNMGVKAMLLKCRPDHIASLSYTKILHPFPRTQVTGL